MKILYAICMFVNAWFSDREFKRGKPVQGVLTAAIAAYCFAQWVRGVW